MAAHMWVEMKYTPVSPKLQADGVTIDVYVTSESEEVAHEDAKLGCWFCNTPLHPDTIHTECDWPSGA